MAMTLRESVDSKASPNQRAAMFALDYCRRNGWSRICDLGVEDLDDLALRFDEISDVDRRYFVERYGEEWAEGAYEEFGRRQYSCRAAFMMDDGLVLSAEEFRRTDVANRGFMMIFEVSQK